MKDSNIQLKQSRLSNNILAFEKSLSYCKTSLLDDELNEYNIDKIYVRTPEEFYGYFQAWVDVIEDCIYEKNLINLAHLTRIYGNNIYVPKIDRSGNVYDLYDINDFTYDEWNQIKYNQQIFNYTYSKLISFDFNWDKFKEYGWGDRIPIISNSLFNFTYKLLTPLVNHDPCLAYRVANGDLRKNEYYNEYKTNILIILNNELNVSN